MLGMVCIFTPFPQRKTKRVSYFFNVTLRCNTDVPYCDAFPNASAGWLDKLDQDMKAPDTLGYFPPPAHLMRPVSPPEQSEVCGTRLTECDLSDSAYNSEDADRKELTS